jgi:hypothetical protein
MALFTKILKGVGWVVLSLIAFGAFYFIAYRYFWYR